MIIEDAKWKTTEPQRGDIKIIFAISSKIGMNKKYLFDGMDCSPSLMKIGEGSGCVKHSRSLRWLRGVAGRRLHD